MDDTFEVNVTFDANGPPAKPAPAEQKKRITSKDRVADLVKRRGRRGLTPDEACIMLGIVIQTCASAFHALHKAGVLVRTGEQRPTRTGKPATVYVHKDRV